MLNTVRFYSIKAIIHRPPNVGNMKEGVTGIDLMKAVSYWIRVLGVMRWNLQLLPVNNGQSPIPITSGLLKPSI